MAFLESKTEFAGIGSVVQLIGLVLFFIFPIGTLFGLLLLVVGSSMSNKLRCSDCGNKVIDKKVKICPICKTEFTEKEKLKSGIFARLKSIKQ